MAVLAAGNWAVTRLKSFIDASRKVKGNRLSMQIGNGVDTYPAGGIPLPSLQAMGLARFIESIQLDDPGSANGFLYKVDEANSKLRIYQGDNTNAAAAPAVELGAVAVASLTVRATVRGW